ncbi:MAG: hypothetical protein KatS3mg105_0593 [Gemmatales bacterium]|nr:MAG: hypothetical protein KatS3mg105_0593 [Gemmatales bacterium]
MWDFRCRNGIETAKPFLTLEAAVVVVREEKGVAWVHPEHVILDRIAGRIKDDSIDPIEPLRRLEERVRRCQSVRFKRLDVEFDAGRQSVVCDQQGQTLAVAGFRQFERAQFFRQPHSFRPFPEGRLDLPAGLGVVDLDLQSRADANKVVGQRRENTIAIGIVREFVSGSFSQRFANAWRIRPVR